MSEESGPHVKVEKKGDMLLPEPPLGQIPLEELATANEGRLTGYLAERGFSVEDIFSSEGLKAFHSAKTSPSAWTREDRLRLALLYAEGLSVEEITAGINQGRAARGSDHKAEAATAKVQASKWLSPLVKDLTAPAQRYRNWHALMKPESIETEEELKQLEAKFGLPRHLIFHLPSDMNEDHKRGNFQRVTAQAKPSPSGFHDVERLVHLMYLKFCKGASEKDLVHELVPSSRRELQKKDLPSFSRIITKQAKEAIGFTVGRPKRAES